MPHVHAGEDNTIRLALVGCGGRGTGAAADALSTTSGPVRLVAMADVFQNRLDGSHAALARDFAKQIDVPPDRRFLGFDAYRKAMDCSRPGDVVILTTPCAFRGVHFAYAIEKGLNVFMEKPTTVDGPSTRKMLALAAASDPQGPQGRRGPHVPPLRGPLGAPRPDPGRPDRGHHLDADLPARRARGQHRAEAGGHERASLAGRSST